MHDPVIRICLREEDFRMAYSGIFRLVFTITLVLMEGFFLLLWGFNPVVTFVVIPGVLAILCGIASLVVCWGFHFVVGPDGVDYCTITQSHHLNWEGLKSSRQVGFLGLHWLVVTSCKTGREFWLPLFVGQYRLLRDLLLTFGDPRLNWEDQLPQVS